MFYHGASTLTTLGRASSLPSPVAPEALAQWAREQAETVMGHPMAYMALSQRVAEPENYRRLQRQRRRDAEALLRLGTDARALPRLTDLLCAIVEEPSWADRPGEPAFDDDGHPGIDFQCAETAALLAWVARGVDSALDPRTQAKLLYEVRRRVFSPFLAHPDYPFMRCRGPRPMAILSDILLSALILETDTARRAAIFKQALRQLDQNVSARERKNEALTDAAAETGAVTDLALLMRLATRGEFDVTGEYPREDWLDALLFPWIDGEYFVDPLAGDLRPPLSGAELYRIGLTAGDEALTALGARLWRLARRPSATVTGRILDMTCASGLESEASKPPRLKHAALSRNRLMVSRFSGFTCAMHTGGRANAGDLILFYGSRPILVETPSGGNLPAVDRGGQLGLPDTPCEADFDLRSDREAMSIELTNAYEAAAYLKNYQRTAMIMRADGAVRREGMLRLVEAMELTAPGRITFRFLTPEAPREIDGGLLLGPVELTWDAELTCAVERTGERFPGGDAAGAPLYRIALTTPQPVGRAFFTFNFAAQA